MKTGRFNRHRITGMAGMPEGVLPYAPTIRSSVGAYGNTPFNRTPHSQRGVVLLIALIMLVAMTLAGIGMMRSVDTGSVIAGNLAFKQATLNSSDAGISVAFSALAAVGNSANAVNDKTILNYNNGSPCINIPLASTAGCNLGVGNINLPGYSSTPISPCEVTGQNTGQVNGVNCTGTENTWWQNDANWANAPCADGNNCNTMDVRYLINRMCTGSGLSPMAGPPNQLCQTFTTTGGGGGHSGLGCPGCGSTSIFYRITSRSKGSRNSTTYTQALALVLR